MSDYCYQCDGCGEFREDCKCKGGFKDPMGFWKEQSLEDIKAEMNLELIEEKYWD